MDIVAIAGGLSRGGTGAMGTVSLAKARLGVDGGRRHRMGAWMLERLCNGLCSGLLVALAALALFAILEVPTVTFGDSWGARGFLFAWGVGLVIALMSANPKLALIRNLNVAGALFCLTATCAFALAAEPARLHPVFRGVNLSFLAIGLVTLAFAWGMRRRLGNKARPGEERLK